MRKEKMSTKLLANIKEIYIYSMIKILLHLEFKVGLINI